MTIPSQLTLELLSDATFGRGEGTAGVVDVEVEYDEHGVPFIGGKTIRGLIRDSWFSMRHCFPELHAAGDRVFGPTKRFLDDDVCILRISDAQLQAEVRQWLTAAATRKDERERIPPERILAACTDVRYQTAEDRETGAPATVTLRATRVLLRELVFEAKLSWTAGEAPSDKDLGVLAMAALATRHGGLARSRGRGHLRITLDGNLDSTRRLASGAQKEGEQ